jgi:hypothetical protein
VFEMMFIAPPVAFRPYSAPCGPRSTSRRCTSNRLLFALVMSEMYEPSV